MRPKSVKPPTLLSDRIAIDNAGLKGYLRRWLRKSIRVPTRVKVILDGGAKKGSVYTTGEAMVSNISFTGALLQDIKLKKCSLPTERFTLRIDFDFNYKGSGALARPVHFGRGKRFEIGVEFLDLGVG